MRSATTSALLLALVACAEPAGDTTADDTDPAVDSDPATPVDTAADTGAPDTGDSGADTGPDVDTADSADTASDPAGCAPGDTSTVGPLGSVACVPAGTFTMGCVAGRDDIGATCFRDESPSHEVTLTRALWVMTAEVTQAQYEALVGSNPSGYSDAGPDPACGDTCPVERVSWDDAVAFATLVNADLGLPDCAGASDPYACDGWRLPTEAEWEHAARAGAATAYSGGATAAAAGWIDSNSSGAPQPVCTRGVNAWSLCDMTGNVMEWVWDAYAFYAADPVTDPVAPPPTSGALKRVHRGGSFTDPAADGRITARDSNPPSYGDGTRLGFRLVRTRAAP